MEPTTENLIQGSAGSSGEKVYVEELFSPDLWLGNPGSSRTITNNIDLDGEGGMVWVKNRDSSSAFLMYDTIRGGGNAVRSDSDDAAATHTDGPATFTSTGYTTGSSGASNHVGMTFRKQKGFFDVVTYTGAASNATQTISHNLGCVPGMILVKNTSITGWSWGVYHKNVDSSAPQSYRLLLNTTDQRDSDTNIWANTAPTATGFTVGNSGLTNADGNTMIAYLFADGNEAAAQIFGQGRDESVIKTGTFSTDGSGMFNVDLGWEPQWLLIKRISSGGDWMSFDNMRMLGWNGSAKLMPNASDAESLGGAGGIYPHATGFKNDTVIWYGGGDDFVYTAIRRGPMKVPTDATEVFNPFLGATPTNSFQRPEKVDMYWFTKRQGWAEQLQVADRLRTFIPTDSNSDDSYATPWVITNDVNQEATSSSAIHMRQGSSMTLGPYVTATSSGSDFLHYVFKRAPEFFDIVCWSGNGTGNRGITHSLGVAPNLMMLKRRSNSDAWWTQYTDIFGTNTALRLNTNDNLSTGVSAFSATSAATASHFFVSSDSSANGTGDNYLAYLFASCPGVSKVGTYTGTGNAVNVDCGFTSGARFVMIKEINTTSNWMVWDTARGINSGSADPMLIPNNTIAEGILEDHLEPLSTGFTVTSHADVSSNGEEYLFLAIA